MPENLPDKKATIVVLSLFQETWKYIHTFRHFWELVQMVQSSWNSSQRQGPIYPA